MFMPGESRSASDISGPSCMLIGQGAGVYGLRFHGCRGSVFFAGRACKGADAHGLPDPSGTGYRGGIDGGFVYGPGNMLLYTSYEDNSIGRGKPGQTNVAKPADLNDFTWTTRSAAWESSRRVCQPWAAKILSFGGQDVTGVRYEKARCVGGRAPPCPDFPAPASVRRPGAEKGKRPHGVLQRADFEVRVARVHRLRGMPGELHPTLPRRYRDTGVRNRRFSDCRGRIWACQPRPAGA